MKRYIYKDIAIKAAMQLLDELEVKGINQAEKLVKIAAILTGGEEEEEKE